MFWTPEYSPRSGHELTQLIEERSGGALTCNFASRYATLYKLEERQWIQGWWVQLSRRAPGFPLAIHADHT